MFFVLLLLLLLVIDFDRFVEFCVVFFAFMVFVDFVVGLAICCAIQSALSPLMRIIAIPPPMPLLAVAIATIVSFIYCKFCPILR